MKVILSLAAAGLLASSAAFAQPANPPAAPATGTTASQPNGKPDVRQMIRSDLQKAGFTDVSIMPNSFLVQAKDRSGDPVTMIVGPNSMTAVVAQAAPTGKDPSSSTDTSSTAGTAPATASADPASSGSMFTTVPPTDRLSSEVVGLDVYNNANQDIGTIKDIAYTGARVQAYIVAVGGFLGMGDHYVAVSPSDLKVSYNASAKKWHANMDTTADQLKNAPAFNYAAKT